MESRPRSPRLIRILRFESALQARSWGLQRQTREAERYVVFLDQGVADVDCGTRTFDLAGPCLLWLGCGLEGQLHVAAGASGYFGAVGDALVAEAVGNTAESGGVAALADDCHLHPLVDALEDQARAFDAFRAIDRELQRPQRGSPLLIAAYLRIVLVTMMRLSGAEEVALLSGGEKSSVLQRFRRLVEANFTSHWTVARYAEALGVSRDRLHTICASELGRPPKALIAERVAREASLRLARSSQTIEQLSHTLGFRDPSHFSNFFKRLTGMSPGRYRRMLKLAEPDRQETAAVSFADWP